MTNVYVVYMSVIYEDHPLFCGIYSSRENARKWIKVLASKWEAEEDDFFIQEYEIDRPY